MAISCISKKISSSPSPYPAPQAIVISTKGGGWGRLAAWPYRKTGFSRGPAWRGEGKKRMVGRRKGEAVRKRINIFSPFLSFYVFLSLLSDNRPTRENKREEWGEVRQKKSFQGLLGNCADVGKSTVETLFVSFLMFEKPCIFSPLLPWQVKNRPAPKADRS